MVFDSSTPFQTILEVGYRLLTRAAQKVFRINNPYRAATVKVNLA
jgi:hypothetical protein